MKEKVDHKAVRKAFIERRDREMEEKRKRLQTDPATKAAKRRLAKKAFSGRVREDLTTDLEKLNDLSRKPAPTIVGRRGKNAFRAFQWIGG